MCIASTVHLFSYKVYDLGICIKSDLKHLSESNVHCRFDSNSHNVALTTTLIIGTGTI